MISGNSDQWFFKCASKKLSRFGKHFKGFQRFKTGNFFQIRSTASYLSISWHQSFYLLGYKAPEVAEWNKYKDEVKRKRKRKLQGTYTDLTATAPAFVDGLDEVGATRAAASSASNVDRSKIFPDSDSQKSKSSIDCEEQKTITSKSSLSASNSNSSFSSTSTTPCCREGTRPPPPRLAPPANAARRRRVADSAEGDEVKIHLCPI